MLEGAEHDVRDFFTRVGPDVDDLVVALTVRDDTAAVLLLDQGDLLVGILQLDVLLLGNDHVSDPDGYTGFHRPVEAKVLELIESLDRRLMTCRAVGAEDDV